MLTSTKQAAWWPHLPKDSSAPLNSISCTCACHQCCNRNSLEYAVQDNAASAAAKADTNTLSANCSPPQGMTAPAQKSPSGNTPCAALHPPAASVEQKLPFSYPGTFTPRPSSRHWGTLAAETSHKQRHITARSYRRSMCHLSLTTAPAHSLTGWQGVGITLHGAHSMTSLQALLP